MVPSIEALAAHYRNRRPMVQFQKETVLNLYRRYLKQREQSLLDAVAAAAAVDALFLSDRIDMSQVTPQMKEAFALAYPNVDLASLANRPPEQLQGFLSAWKGKYFEVLVRDRLNAGEWVGDLHIESGQTAVLAQSATQPGWDLRILDADGSVVQDLQLKATQSLFYVKEALERYPHIDVIATDEVLDSGGEALEGLFASGLYDTDLEAAIRAPMESLFDSPFEELWETILPGLPFILIAVGEGRQVLMGRKSFDLALGDALYRGVKTGAAIAVGAAVAALDGGLLSIPASFLTRLGFDRHQIMRRTVDRLDRRIVQLRQLRPSSMLPARIC